MSDIAIRVENLGKLYRIGESEHYKTLRESMVRAGRRLFGRSVTNKTSRADAKEFWALQDVSFEVKQGEVMGIIGRNGAGKSTLLKILSRITEPTAGRVELFGRVGSLLEVGTGFHPELTGRENIYLNGAILGMSRAEIRSNFDEIVAFAGVEQFIDTPVKRYSSGMYVRLAFAVAAHLEPEILIVDEVLAVGDADFQKRCLGKMGEVARSGRTVLFVSHNMAAVEALCTSAARIDKGRLVDVGEVYDVISKYSGAGDDLASEVDLTIHSSRRSHYPVLLERLRILNATGEPLKVANTGDDISFELTIAPTPNVPNASIIIYVLGPHGEKVMGFFSLYTHPQPIDINGGAKVVCTMQNARLMPGKYHLEVQLRYGRNTIDEVSEIWFEIATSDVYGTGLLPPVRRSGCVAPEVAWQVETPAMISSTVQKTER